MKSSYQIPRVEAVEVPRPHVVRVTFADGVVRELQFLTGNNQGTVFEELENTKFFEQVRVDPESGTVVWPNGVDLDPAVLHGDFPPAGKNRFREISSTRQKKHFG